MLSKGDIYNNGPSALLEINLKEEHVELVSCANVSCCELFLKMNFIGVSNQSPLL
jgi:hypothetical protein